MTLLQMLSGRSWKNVGVVLKVEPPRPGLEIAHMTSPRQFRRFRISTPNVRMVIAIAPRPREFRVGATAAFRIVFKDAEPPATLRVEATVLSFNKRTGRTVLLPLEVPMFV